MVTGKEIMAYIEGSKGASIRQLGEKFGLSMKDAAQVMQQLWVKDLVSPMAGAVFAPPVKPGEPHHFNDSRSSSMWQEHWFSEYKSKYKEYFTVRKDEGRTLTDLLILTDQDMGDIKAARADARKACEAAVVKGKLVSMTASAGGMMGRPPKIYGLTIEACRKRNDSLIREVVEDKAARKAKRGRDADA